MCECTFWLRPGFSHASPSCHLNANIPGRHEYRDIVGEYVCD